MTASAPAGVARVAPVSEIRAHFPALERRYGGSPVAYFDGPGGTQVPIGVVDAMREYLLGHNANTHWPYPTSEETDAAIVSARTAFADLLGSSPDEIAFGANMTTLTFHVARALGRAWGPGDEVVVTELDHHANVAPWQALARERGITLRVVRLDPDRGVLDEADLAAAIGPRTRLVAVGAASNALGTITDIARITEAAHSAGALAYVDAVHYAAHAVVDVEALGCDFLACSSYKFYGPHLGILYGRRERLAALDVPKLAPAPDTVPERLETGTQNHEGIVGAAAAVDFLASLVSDGDRRARLHAVGTELHRRGLALTARAWDRLSALDGAVRLYGPPPTGRRTPTIAFSVSGVPSSRVVRALAALGVFASCGDFYAATVIERLGMRGEGLVRAGCACYTTVDEVDRLVEGVREVIAGR